MGSQNWWLGDPRTLLYRVNPLHRRVQWFLGCTLSESCTKIWHLTGANFWLARTYGVPSGPDASQETKAGVTVCCGTPLLISHPATFVGFWRFAFGRTSRKLWEMVKWSCWCWSKVLTTTLFVEWQLNISSLFHLSVRWDDSKQQETSKNSLNHLTETNNRAVCPKTPPMDFCPQARLSAFAAPWLGVSIPVAMSAGAPRA